MKARKALALVLTLCMILGMIPTWAMAAPSASGSRIVAGWIDGYPFQTIAAADNAIGTAAAITAEYPADSVASNLTVKFLTTSTADVVKYVTKASEPGAAEFVTTNLAKGGTMSDGSGSYQVWTISEVNISAGDLYISVNDGTNTNYYKIATSTSADDDAYTKQEAGLKVLLEGTDRYNQPVKFYFQTIAKLVTSYATIDEYMGATAVPTATLLDNLTEDAAPTISMTIDLAGHNLTGSAGAALTLGTADKTVTIVNSGDEEATIAPNASANPAIAQTNGAVVLDGDITVAGNVTVAAPAGDLDSALTVGEDVTITGTDSGNAAIEINGTADTDGANTLAVTVDGTVTGGANKPGILVYNQNGGTNTVTLNVTGTVSGKGTGAGIQIGNEDAKLSAVTVNVKDGATVDGGHTGDGAYDARTYTGVGILQYCGTLSVGAATVAGTSGIVTAGGFDTGTTAYAANSALNVTGDATIYGGKAYGAASMTGYNITSDGSALLLASSNVAAGSKIAVNISGAAKFESENAYAVHEIEAGATTALQEYSAGVRAHGLTVTGKATFSGAETVLHDSAIKMGAAVEAAGATYVTLAAGYYSSNPSTYFGTEDTQSKYIAETYTAYRANDDDLPAEEAANVPAGYYVIGAGSTDAALLSMEINDVEVLSTKLVGSTDKTKPTTLSGSPFSVANDQGSNELHVLVSTNHKGATAKYVVLKGNDVKKVAAGTYSGDLAALATAGDEVTIDSTLNTWDADNVVVLEVTAADGVTKNYYQFQVKVGNDTSTLSKAFDKTFTSTGTGKIGDPYVVAVEVPCKETKLTVTADDFTASETGATVELFKNGFAETAATSVTIGDGEFVYVHVTSADGKANGYYRFQVTFVNGDPSLNTLQLNATYVIGSDGSTEAVSAYDTLAEAYENAISVTMRKGQLGLDADGTPTGQAAALIVTPETHDGTLAAAANSTNEETSASYYMYNADASTTEQVYAFIDAAMTQNNVNAGVVTGSVTTGVLTITDFFVNSNGAYSVAEKYEGMTLFIKILAKDTKSVGYYAVKISYEDEVSTSALISQVDAGEGGGTVAALPTAAGTGKTDYATIAVTDVHLKNNKDLVVKLYTDFASAVTYTLAAATSDGSGEALATNAFTSVTEGTNADGEACLIYEITIATADSTNLGKPLYVKVTPEKATADDGYYKLTFALASDSTSAEMKSLSLEPNSTTKIEALTPTVPTTGTGSWKSPRVISSAASPIELKQDYFKDATALKMTVGTDFAKSVKYYVLDSAWTLNTAPTSGAVTMSNVGTEDLSYFADAGTNLIFNNRGETKYIYFEIEPKSGSDKLVYLMVVEIEGQSSDASVDSLTYTLTLKRTDSTGKVTYVKLDPVNLITDGTMASATDLSANNITYSNGTFSVTLPYSEEYTVVSVTAEATSESATVAINGDSNTTNSDEADVVLTSNSGSATVVAMAQDGSDSETYVISFTRTAASSKDDATLAYSYTTGSSSATGSLNVTGASIDGTNGNFVYVKLPNATGLNATETLTSTFTLTADNAYISNYNSTNYQKYQGKLSVEDSVTLRGYTAYTAAVETAEKNSIDAGINAIDGVTANATTVILLGKGKTVTVTKEDGTPTAYTFLYYMLSTKGANTNLVGNSGAALTDASNGGISVKLGSASNTAVQNVGLNNPAVIGDNRVVSNLTQTITNVYLTDSTDTHAIAGAYDSTAKAYAKTAYVTVAPYDNNAVIAVTGSNATYDAASKTFTVQLSDYGNGQLTFTVTSENGQVVTPYTVNFYSNVVEYTTAAVSSDDLTQPIIAGKLVTPNAVVFVNSSNAPLTINVNALSAISTASESLVLKTNFATMSVASADVGTMATNSTGATTVISLANLTTCEYTYDNGMGFVGGVNLSIKSNNTNVAPHGAATIEYPVEGLIATGTSKTFVTMNTVKKPDTAKTALEAATSTWTSTKNGVAVLTLNANEQGELYMFGTYASYNVTFVLDKNVTTPSTVVSVLSADGKTAYTVGYNNESSAFVGTANVFVPKSEGSLSFQIRPVTSGQAVAYVRSEAASVAWASHNQSSTYKSWENSYDSETNTYTVTGINADTRIYFGLAAPYTLTNNTAANANGTITLSATSAAAGAKVTVTPNPAEGYELKSLTVTSSAGTIELGSMTKNTDGTYSFAMPAGNATIVATFGGAVYTLDMDTVNHYGKDIKAYASATERTTPITTVAHGSTAYIVITPAVQYPVLSSLTVNDTEFKTQAVKQDDGTYLFTLATATVIPQITLTGTTLTVVATFEAEAPDVTVTDGSASKGTAKELTGTVANDTLTVAGTDVVVALAKSDTAYTPLTKLTTKNTFTVGNATEIVLVRVGDVNLDGKVDVSDATLLLQHTVGQSLTGLALEAGKISKGDSLVDVSDATLALQYSVNVANAIAW